MTNPFTRYLSQWSTDKAFAEFVERWDRLERIVVGVYRQKIDLDAAARDFDDVWPWLRRHYGQWAAALRPYWLSARAAGEPVQTDPFLLLLDLAGPDHIPGHWRAMQHLPAAREAINRYLVENS